MDLPHMRSQTSACEQIVQQIYSRLCLGTKETREQHWRDLVRSLRQLGYEVGSVTDAVMEFLVNQAGASFGRGSPTPPLYQEYRKLTPADKNKVDQRYRECLEVAKAEFPHVFYVQVINVPAAPADVWLAERTPSSELPRLNKELRSMAKALGIPEQEYARSEAAKQFSEERYRLHAERCWDFLMEAARPHSVDAVEVIYDVFSGRFYCELRHDGRARRFFLDARLVSEPLQQGDRIGLEKARDSIRFAVDQTFASQAGPAVS
jgi:hypothetical protein